jgi:hypothetical protein
VTNTSTNGGITLHIIFNQRGVTGMSLSTHVEALCKKHATIDEIIEQEEHRPIPDSIRLMQLKRQKLRIKEELGRFEAPH